MRLDPFDKECQLLPRVLIDRAIGQTDLLSIGIHIPNLFYFVSGLKSKVLDILPVSEASSHRRKQDIDCQAQCSKRKPKPPNIVHHSNEESLDSKEDTAVILG